MTISRFSAAVLLSFVCVTAPAQQPWEDALHKRHDELVAENGPGTDAALREQLLAMRKQDQDVRFRSLDAPAAEKAAAAADILPTDRKLTSQLKSIVQAHGWPTIHLVGYDASFGAMLILSHTPDHEWQRSLLPQLEQLAQQNQIDGSQLAVVIDKELVSEGKLQRYGSQFKFVDGQAMMIAVEDPAHLEDRRAAVILPPMSVYRQQLTEMYHVPISDVILRP